MLVVYLTYEIVYIFFSLAIVQGGLQAMVPGRGGRGVFPLVFVLSVLNRDYDFVQVRPIYKRGIGCTIDFDWLGEFCLYFKLHKGNDSNVKFALLQLPIKWS